MRNLAVLVLLTCTAWTSAEAAARGCATYSRGGDFAAVELRKGLHLKLNLAATATEAQMAIPFAVTGCQVAFSKDSALLAVALDTEGKSAGLELALFDVAGRRWVKPAPNKISLAPDSRGEMVGFLRDSHDLLVLSSGLYFEAENRTTVFVAIVDPIEGKATTSAVAVQASTIASAAAVDLDDGRIWIAQPDGPPCHLRSYPVGRHVTETAHSLVAPDCKTADLMIAPSQQGVLKVSHDAGTVLFQLIDGKTGKTQSVALTPPEKSDSYWVDGSYSVSPDGKVVALGVKNLRRSKVGGMQVDNEVIAIGTDPLKILGTTPVNALPQDFVVRKEYAGLALSTLTDKGWNRQGFVTDEQMSANAEVKKN